MSWISKAELRRLLRQLSHAEQRAEQAESALALERHENRRAERHLTNQLLRKAGSFPQSADDRPAAVEPAKPLVPLKPSYDPGELEALEIEAARLGLTKAQARAFFARERGLDESDLIN